MKKTVGIAVATFMVFFSALIMSTCDLFNVSLVEYLKEEWDKTPEGKGDAGPWVYVAVGAGNDGDPGWTETKPVKTLKKALEIWADQGSTEARIMLTEDIAVSSSYNDPQALTGSGLVDFSTNQLIPPAITAITLAGSGNGKIINNEGTAGRPVLYINTANKAITLKNLTITGGRGVHGAGIHIGSGVSLIIADNVTVKDNQASIEGGGVYVNGMNSHLVMTGGEIRNNKVSTTTITGKGGGVCVGTNGTFTMKGGIIRTNESDGDGGGVHVNDGTFTMEGGTVTANKSGIVGGGIYISGKNSKALILNGAIGGASAGNGNTAQYGAGIYVGDGGSLELGTAKEDHPYPDIQHNTSSGTGGGGGGGIVINGTGGQAIFHHGSIRNNNGTAWGGGVYITNGKLDMRGGTVTGNTATTGPGIMVRHKGEFFMSGSARISDAANPVYLGSPQRWITIGASGFTGNYATTMIAEVTTEGPYSAKTKILKHEGGGSVAVYCDYFNVDGKGFGKSLNSDGTMR